MKRVEVLLGCGFEKTRLKLPGPSRGRRAALRLVAAGEVRRGRIDALAAEIHELAVEVENNTEDWAIELGAARAAWHALRGEICVDRRAGGGGALQIEAAVKRKDGDAPFNERFARCAEGSATAQPGAELSRQLSQIVEQDDGPAPGTWSPMQYSPAVSPRTIVPTVVTKERTPSPVPIQDQNPRAYARSSILKGSKAKMEEPTDNSAGQSTPLPNKAPPSPEDSPLKPRPSSSRVEPDPDVSDLVTGMEELNLARTNRGPARGASSRPVPWIAPRKRNGNWLQERHAAKENAIATSPWRTTPSNKSGIDQHRNRGPDGQAVPPRDDASSDEGGVRLEGFEVKKEVGEAAPKAEAESAASRKTREQDQEEQKEKEEEWAKIRRRLQESAQRTLDKTNSKKRSL